MKSFIGTALVTAFAVVYTLSAQESINNASISGQISDPSGAAIEGAQVTARQIETNASSTSATDSEGRFRFSYLKVGGYEIRIHKDGFGDATRKLTLSAGSAFELPVQLAIASANANVTVSSQAEVLETVEGSPHPIKKDLEITPKQAPVAFEFFEQDGM